MLRILPLASGFHSAEQVRNSTGRLLGLLEAQAVPHELAPAGSANTVLVLTGGTEHLALRALESRPGPAILLAHPDQNSLPAAMEILSNLRQQGRRGRIVLLKEGSPEPAAVARYLGVHERLSGLRLGRIGAPSDWLVGSMPDPSVVRRAWGPKVVDVPLEDLRAAMDEVRPEEADDIRQEFLAGTSGVREPSEADLAMAARVAAGLARLVASARLDACTVRCFDLVVDLRTTGCLALSRLLDRGIVAGCEGDLPAALTMLWMQAISGGTSFMANPQDLDAAANTLWLAHCTIARSLVKRYTLRSHFESSLGVGIQGELEPGPWTLARIGGADLGDCFISDGELLANGDSELRCRTQVQLRLEQPVGLLLDRPVGNHHVLVPGHWGADLRAYRELFI